MIHEETISTQEPVDYNELYETLKKIASRYDFSQHLQTRTFLPPALTPQQQADANDFSQYLQTRTFLPPALTPQQQADAIDRRFWTSQSLSVVSRGWEPVIIDYLTPLK